MLYRGALNNLEFQAVQGTLFSKLAVSIFSTKLEML